MSISLGTIGVYGTSKSSFFEALRTFGATHFVDIRRRRGLRGSQYAYANASALQRALSDMGITYIHDLRLAPTNEVRNAQKNADKDQGEEKRNRLILSQEFISRFRKELLEGFDTHEFISGFPDGSHVVFFCVERRAEACHRSIVAAEIATVAKTMWRDITP